MTKVNILHGDLDYDKFFSPMVFGLVNGSADHNFGMIPTRTAQLANYLNAAAPFAMLLPS